MTELPAAPHLDLDALADVLAGERDDDPHLRRCASCADRLAELAAAEVSVVASLATLPEPPLPEGLSERLATALRAEGARDATVTPLRRRPARPWLPAVAASLVLVLAGGLGLALLRGPQAGGDAATSAADGGGAESGGRPSLAEASALQHTASGADYADPAQREAVLPQVLAGTAADAAPPAPAAPGPDGAELPDPAAGTARSLTAGVQRLRDPRALADCLAALSRAGAAEAVPRALDDASYRGAPALAVFSDDGDPRGLLLTVVDPRCSSGDPAVLLRVRVDRP